MILFAPAKLTLSLKVKGLRQDGLHLIEAEMVSLDLMDTLEIGKGDGLKINEEYLNFNSVLPEKNFVPTGPDNLVSKSLKLLNREAFINIKKKIPPGSGLGGGSADAAAVLRWGSHSDLASASTIGADVAFCLKGGRAMVTGIGEKVSQLDYLEKTFTLLCPPLFCSTELVYQRWDELDGPKGDNGNDLEPAAIDLYPELKKWRDSLGDATGESPRLAGSGSSWFVEGSYPSEGHLVVSTIPIQDAD